MAAKTSEILFNKTFDWFRRSFRRSSTFNPFLTRRISNSSSTSRNSVPENCVNKEINTNITDINSTTPLECFVNRNPKNPEYFGYNKQRGYSTQYKKRDFFKRLHLVLSNRHVKAYVEDQNGKVLVKASTEEFDVRKHLYKANDVSAAVNVGRVLADRCLRAGLNRVSMYTTDLRKKEKFQEFRKAISKGGVELTEPARVVPPETFHTGISVRKIRKGIIGMKMNNSTKRKFT